MRLDPTVLTRRRPVGSWKRDEVYDAVFALRMLLALGAGLVAGIGALEGLPVVLG